MDQHAIEALGLPGRVLMENAARTVAERLRQLLPASATAAPVVVCCGSGNNGGDGYAAARLLVNAGVKCVVVRAGAPATPDAAANAQAWAHFGPTLDFEGQRPQAEAALRQAPALVDAVFGTGLTRPVQGAARDLILAMDLAPPPLKVAVDLPSGLDADTGAVLGAAVRCTHTVCLQLRKVGCTQYPGAAYCGALEVAPVSIPERWPDSAPGTYLLTLPFAAALLPPRPPAGHKGTFGHLLAVCGSAGMGGAALLAGLAALKSGTGLVTVGVPAALRDHYITLAPELMTLSLAGGETTHFEAAHAEVMAAQAARRSAMVLGCGLGRHPHTTEFVNRLIAAYHGPLLVDADGLNALNPSGLAALRPRAAPAVITPHPGELARLAGLEPEALAADRVGHARRLAAQWNVVLVLKGAGTVVSDPSGAAFISATGDAGLASGGTGDVLSGVIGGLLAQGLAALPAALLGVTLHGLARDLARDQLASGFFSASDLIRGLNAALKALGRA